MRQLYILIGLPRSGKSTWTEEHKKNKVIVSADRFRSRMYGQRFYLAGEGLMWAVRDIFLRELLSQGVDIVVDETSIDFKTRAKIIEAAHAEGYEVTAVWFSTSISTCVERAKATGQEDLIPIIEKMGLKRDKPLLSEGFLNIQTIDELGNVVESVWRDLPKGTQPTSIEDLYELGSAEPLPFGRPMK